MATITINGESVNIPDFAMEATLQRVATATGMSQGILTSIMRGNKISAAGLKNMEKHLTVIKQDTKTNNNDTKRGNKDAKEAAAKAAAQRKQAMDNMSQNLKQGFNALAKGNTSLQGTLGPMIQGVTAGAEGFAKMIPKVGKYAEGAIGALTKATTATVGFALGVTDEFAAQAKAMTQITGGGLYDNMLSLRTSAGEAGLYLKDLTNALEQSSRSVATLGSDVDDGMRNFTKLSKEFALGTKQYGDFGFSVAELNSVMLQEIEIMQRMGLSQEEVNRRLKDTSGGLQMMLYETTAMAQLTGSDRREMIRARMAERTDALGGLYRAGLSTEEQTRLDNSANVVQAMLGDELGPQLTKIANFAMQSGMGMEAALELQGGQGMTAANAFLQSNAGVGLADIMRAYIAGDVGAIAGMGDQLQGIMGNQAGIRSLSAIAMADGGASGQGATTVLNSIMQLNQSMQRLRNQDLDNLQLDAQPGGQAEQLGTKDRNIQTLTSQLLTKLINTEVPGIGVKPGDTTEMAAFVNSFIDSTRGTLGLDGDLGEGYDAAQVVAAMALFSAQQMASSQMNADPGSGGGGSIDYFAEVDKKGNKPGTNKPGFFKKSAKAVMGGLKTAGGLLFSFVGGRMLLSAAGAGIGAIAASSMAPFIAAAVGVAALAGGAYLGYKALTGDETGPEKQEIIQANNQALTSINSIKRTNLGSIMEGFDPSNGQADLMVRLGVIMEKSGKESVLALKEIQNNTFFANGLKRQQLDEDKKFYVEMTSQS